MKIVSVPFSGGSLGKNPGCEKAPELILEGKEFKILNIDNQNIIKTNEILEHAEGDFFIGGDHSITYSLFKGFTKNKKNAGLVIFDAHPDCINNFSPPTHEDFLRVLIEENIVKPEKVLIIGLRSIDEIEKKFMDDKKITYILMKDLKDDNSYNNLINKIKKFVEKLDSWYLSLDIDVLDPSHAPGTGYPEKEGMDFYNFKKVLNNISLFGNLGRVDIVEVNPDKDIDGKTIKCAREILKIFSNL